MEKQTELLKNAMSEIKSLRRQNEIKSARLDMFDSVMSLLNSRIETRPQGMSPDLVWEIEKFVNSQEKSVELDRTCTTSLAEKQTKSNP